MTAPINPIPGFDIQEPHLPDGLIDRLVDLLPDAIIILSDSLQILFFNSAAEEMFGYIAPEVIGKKADIFIPEIQVRVHHKTASKFIAGHDSTKTMGANHIVYGKHRAGHLIPLGISVSRQIFQNRTFLICSIRNSANQMLFEQALTESEQRYRGMLESQNALVVRMDPNGCFVFANQAYCQMFGKSPAELIGKSHTPHVHPDDLPKTLVAMQELENPPYRINLEQRVMTSTGWRWIAWEESVIQNAGNSKYEIQAFGVDITERKNAEAELSNKIVLLSGILNSIPDIVFFKDVKGIYLGCNPEFSRLVGKSIDEIVNKTDYDLFGQEVADSFRDNDRKMLAQGKNRTNEELVKYPNGEQVLLETLKAPLYDTQGKAIGILGISRNITSRKKLEEIAIVERNLAIFLAQKSSLSEALPLCLDLALGISEMDCGGIYMIEHQSGDLVLMTHRGLSESFVDRAKRFLSGSPQFNVVMQGNPIYQPYLHLPTSKNKVALEEGLHISAIIPVIFNGQIIACINVASHSLDDMSVYARSALENMALQIGNMIARFQAQDDLRDSRNELQSMFDSLQDYVFVLDQGGDIIEVNQKVLDGLGYSKRELVGANVLVVHPPEEREKAWGIVQDMLSGEIDTCPLDLLKKEGAYLPVETKVVRGRWGNQDVLIGVSRDITERKAAETVIQERVKEIESFFNVSLDLLCIGDFNGNFLRLNKAWEATFGYSLDEIYQGKFIEFIHPDDRFATLKAILGLRKGRKILNFINRFRSKDGSWRSIEWRSKIEEDKVFAAARDITERKIAEDARIVQTRQLEYRQKFEETLTSISTRFINMPPTDINLEINSVLKQIGEFEQVDRCYVFQVDQLNAMMTNTHEWCAPGVDAQIENLKDIPTGLFPWWIGKMTRLEEVHIPVVANLPVEAQAEREILEGQSIQSVLVVPIVSRNTMIGYLGFDSVVRQRTWSQDSILLIKMVSDILSNALMRIKMHDDLVQSESRNTALLSAVPDQIFRIRRDGVFLDFKTSSNELLPMAADQIIGSSIKNLVPEERIEETLNCIEQALQSEVIQSMEYTLKIGDSSRVYEARFKDSGPDEVTAIVRDISDRARLEQMKSDFINRATHELRTPVATMLLMVNLIDGDPTGEEFKECWEILKSELSRERLLVEDLLSAGRLESNQAVMHLRFLDINDVISQAFREIEPPAKEKNIAFVLHPMDNLDETTNMINADEAALSQVFVNLFSNAVKFTPSGGSVDIFMKRANQGVEISITDSGIGIPSEDIPLLFNRFFRGTNAIEQEIPGTGIGLFIVRSILEKHGGNIKVHSELGHGAEFVVWLPNNSA